MKPLITYYGGKQRMANNIVPLIPPHIIYCEPFAGSAAVLFAKPVPKKFSHGYGEVLNDLNTDLILMYWQAKTNPDFLTTIRSCPFSDYWHNWANMVLLSDRKDKLSRAVAKYVSHRQGFNNDALMPWAREPSGMIRSKIWSSRQEDINQKCERLKSVAFDCVDAVACIEKWDSPATFFYVDPPYLGTSLGGMGQWSPNDLQRLTKALNESRGSYIISGYSEHTNALRGSVQREFRASCAASNISKSQQPNGKSRTEVIWMRGPSSLPNQKQIDQMQKQTCFTGPLLGPCPLPLAR